MNLSTQSPAASTSKPAAPATSIRTPAQVALEASCVDLLCKLEFLFSQIKESDAEERAETAHKTAEKMLTTMTEFANEVLDGKANKAIEAEIELGMVEVKACEELLKSRSWGNLICQTFGAADPDQQKISAAHTKLLQAVKQALVTLFFHTIKLVGVDTAMGTELDQSVLIFTTELKSL